MTAPEALATRALSRRYGARKALDDLTLSVPTGAFYAFVGPNGAGKSTTVRILAALIRPTSGSARVLGLDVERSALDIRRRIGVVPDFPVLFDSLSPRENILRLSRLRRIDDGAARRRLEELAAGLGMSEHLDTPVEALSHGTRKKAGLASAMIHGPGLLFLDEPFEGIDPLSARGIRRMLEALRQRGVTIFLTSHVLPLVESLATHVGIIDGGRLLASGTLEEILAGNGSLEDALLDRLGAETATPTLDWYQP